MSSKMNYYSSSAEVNTNIIEPKDERRDLGQEFLSNTSMDANSAPYDCQNCCTEQMITFGEPFVTDEGFISLIISKDVKVDISASHAICVSTPTAKAAVNHMGHSIGIIHPFGRVFHESGAQNICHIESGTHLAKMCGRGVTFTSLNRSLIYLVDNSGCKTTTERFRKLSYDFTTDIFNSNALSGEYARQRAFNDLLRHSWELSDDGTDKIWYLAGLRIRQNLVTGDVMISKSFGKIVIRVNPSKNQIKINAPNLRIMASNCVECCLLVVKPHNRDEQRVVSTFDNFRVKYGSQKAGFDLYDQLVLM